MRSQIPQTTRAVLVRKSSSKSSNGYVNNASLETLSIPPLKDGEILVKIHAFAFNHRDVWIRLGKYPSIEEVNKRVFFAPSHGWDEHPDAPESEFGVIGGVRWPAVGTFAEYVVIEKDKVFLSAPHLSDINMAAWPLAGVTAWRATMINAAVELGQNILITGIGGGVALVALQLAVAQGASVYVTSGSEEKINRAISLGAKGGASYKNPNWPKEIHKLIRKNSPAGSSTFLDAVIDSGGGDIMSLVGSILKQGGRVVCYGMTANPKITFTMREVLRNQKLLGSTMGSTQDLHDATKFLSKHKIVPVVSHVFRGLENVEKGFEMLRTGEQFGKVVIEVGNAHENLKTKL
ncbi:NAD(P)-binding protein [Rhodocollybia butyracea]|uniref:NAD(P)-binding protein n=1 Tax=Rhodocollybia butyracea TaxID=206335 RepID=A0A9P5PU65_9AGAR|nr:NAD(P)-binding protein [Rhodocollybia butyracea]